MRIILIALMSLFIGLSNANATNDIKETDIKESQILGKIENYLNNMMTMEADFTQASSNGNIVDGKLYISKPKKLRMEYNEPMPVSIIGDGDYIIYIDKELDQVTHIDYKDIPASILFENNISFNNKNININSIEKDAGTTRISLNYKDSSYAGEFTLIFQNAPFELKQWQIIDAQNISTIVSLYNLNRDIKLDNNLFKYKKDKKKSKNRNRK